MTADELPIRTCGKCGRPAAGTGVTMWSVSFVSVSSAQHYRCMACQATFSVEPRWTFIRNLLGGVLAVALGAFLLTNPSGKEDAPIGWMFLAVGVVAFGYVGLRHR